MDGLGTMDILDNGAVRDGTTASRRSMGGTTVELETQDFADLVPKVLPIGGSSKLARTVHG